MTLTLYLSIKISLKSFITNATTLYPYTFTNYIAPKRRLLPRKLWAFSQFHHFFNTRILKTSKELDLPRIKVRLGLLESS